MLKPARILATLLAALALGACARSIEPPTAAATAAATEVPVGALVTLDASQSTDPNSPALPIFYKWAFKALPAGSQARLNDSTIVNPSFTADVEGTYTVVLVVSNAKVSSEPAEVAVTAGPCGASRPAIASVSASPSAPGIDQVVQLSASVADADLDSPCSQPQGLSYAWALTALPAGSHAALNQADALNPSFTTDVAGDYALRLVVTDSTGRASDPFELTVTASLCGGNAPSVEAPVASPAAPNIGQLVQLTAAASDADNAEGCAKGQQLAYHWYFVSLPSGSHAAFNDASIESPSFQPDLAGDYVVRVKVTDDTGRSTVSAPTTVQVSPCGGAQPTVAEIEASPAAPNARQIVQLTATIEDADSLEPCSLPQSFSYAWTMAAQPAGSEARLNNAIATNPSFVADIPGDYVVALVVTDGTGLRSASKSFTVTVSSCGAGVPVATIDAVPSAAIGSLVQVGADVSDADTVEPCSQTESFQFAWSFESLPQGSAAALNAAGVSSPSFVPDVAGDYVLRLVVTDSAGHASQPALATVTVTGCGGNAPVAAIGANPAAPALGQPVLLNASATDADNDEPCSAGQSFAWRWAFDALPAGSAATLNSATAAQPSFVPDLPGDYLVRLIAVDSTGRESQPATLTVTVSACGGAIPTGVATALPAAPAIGQAVQLTAVPSDADNTAECGGSQTFSFLWSFESLPAGSHAVLNSTTAIAPSFVPDLPGDYVARLVITDSTGLRSAPITITASATDCGSAAPEATATALPEAPAIGQPVLLHASATDADNAEACNAGQSFTFHWSFETLPAGSRASLNSATATEPSFVPDVAGAYVIGLVATDSTGRASARASVTVTASSCGANRPVATVTTTPASIGAGMAVRLVPEVLDADSDPACALEAQSFSYAWTLLSAPAGSLAALSGTSAREPSFVADMSGDYLVRLVVTDSTGLSSQPVETVVSVGTCGANAPTISGMLATPSTALVGGAVELSATFDDADNGTECQAILGAPQQHRYAWRLVSAPVGSSASIARADTLAASLVVDVPGSYVAELVITDSTGRSTSAQVTVTGDTCGAAAPEVTPALDPSSRLFIGGLAVLHSNLADTDQGCDLLPAETYLFRWWIAELPAGSRATLDNPYARDVSFTPDAAGRYVIAVVAEDSAGHVSATRTVPVDVADCGGSAPIAHITAPATVGGLPAQVQVDALGSGNPSIDPDDACLPQPQTLSFRWEIFSAPIGSRAALYPSATATNPWFRADVAGSYVIRLRVTDSTGRVSAPAEETITATAP